MVNARYDIILMRNYLTDFYSYIDSGKVLATALLKLVKNVTEPTVVKYTLARMEELLPDGLRLRKRVAFFVEEGKPIDAAPFLRMIRNDTGYVQYAASHVLALFLTYVHCDGAR
jgi:V-type H+-transporting ATPase subunit H